MRRFLLDTVVARTLTNGESPEAHPPTVPAKTESAVAELLRKARERDARERQLKAYRREMRPVTQATTDPDSLVAWRDKASGVVLWFDHAHGDDAWDGTRERPLRTWEALQRRATLLRSRPPGDRGPGTGDSR